MPGDAKTPNSLGLSAARRVIEVLTAGDSVPDRDLPSIPGYRIGCRLGEGGGGEVFLGVRDGSDRMLAIKLLDRRFGSGSTAPRAWRELDILSQLHLPAVPRVIDYGRHEGRMYIATEYINGQTLDQHCGTGFQPRQEHHGADARTQDPGPGTQDSGPSTQNATQHSAPSTQHGPLDLRARVALLARVADAVQTLHEHGIIHRDLKPANILVDQHGDPMIIDLGLATLISGDPMLTVTAEGIPLGSPAYMAPEQARGERANISTRTDVYGLGATAYMILTGRTPHDLRTGPPSGASAPPDAPPALPEGASFADVIHRVATTAPRDPRALSATLPTPLAAVLLKAVAARPADRYPSAAALAADLRRWIEGEPVTAQPPTRWAQATRWIARHPILTTGAACGALIVLSVALLYVSVYWVSLQPYRVAIIDEGSAVVLLSRAGHELHRWPADRKDGAVYAALVERPPEFGGGQMVLTIVKNAGLDDLNSQLCAWDPNSRDRPLRVAPGRRARPDAPTLPYADEWNVYSAQPPTFADIFPESPGPEIVVVHNHQDRSPRVIRILDWDFKVLCEVWHDGDIYDKAFWLGPTRRLVFTGANCEIDWAQPFGIQCEGQLRLFAAFAIEPKLGTIAGFIRGPNADPRAAAMLAWYGVVLPADTWLNSTLFEASRPRPEGLADSAIEIALHGRTRSDGVALVIDANGKLIPNLTSPAEGAQKQGRAADSLEFIPLAELEASLRTTIPPAGPPLRTGRAGVMT